MILFVFEGSNREPYVYKTIERLYFPKKNDNIICSFGNNIYDLYSEMMKYGGDGDIVSIMRERLSESGDSTLHNIRSTDISEVYLFFDYDFQNSQFSLEEINQRVDVMLKMFDDETGNGKLYINYPMVESIRYTKELPDEEYRHYTVSRALCHDFKRLAVIAVLVLIGPRLDAAVQRDHGAFAARRGPFGDEARRKAGRNGCAVGRASVPGIDRAAALRLFEGGLR